MMVTVGALMVSFLFGCLLTALVALMAERVWPIRGRELRDCVVYLHMFRDLSSGRESVPLFRKSLLEMRRECRGAGGVAWPVKHAGAEDESYWLGLEYVGND